MPDREDHSPLSRDQAHALGPADEEAARQDEPSAEAGGQPSPADGDAGISPEEAMKAMTNAAGDAAADALEDADDEIDRLVAEVEALVGLDESVEADEATALPGGAAGPTDAAVSPPEAAADALPDPAGVEMPRGQPSDAAETGEAISDVPEADVMPSEEDADGGGDFEAPEMADEVSDASGNTPEGGAELPAPVPMISMEAGERPDRSSAAADDDEAAAGREETALEPVTIEHSEPAAPEEPVHQLADAAAQMADGAPTGEAGLSDEGSASTDGARGTGDDRGLSEIDEALAQDVEELLEGSYEVVSRVLDDVFDEHAIAVPEGKEEDAVDGAEAPETADSGQLEDASAVSLDEIADVEAALRALTDSAAFESVEEVVGRQDDVSSVAADTHGVDADAEESTAPTPADAPSESRTTAPTDAPSGWSTSAVAEPVAEPRPDPAGRPSAPAAPDFADPDQASQAAVAEGGAPPAAAWVAPAGVDASPVESDLPDTPDHNAVDSTEAASQGPASELLPTRQAGQANEAPAAAEASTPPSKEPAPPEPISERPAPRESAAASDAPTTEEPRGTGGAEVAEVAPPIDETEDEPVGIGMAERIRSFLCLAGSVIRPVLEVLSFPLRFVPPSLRPLVDWIALSLVFWVPIVWIVVLFVMGH